MPIHHDTPENPSSQEPYFQAKTQPLTAAVGTHAVDGSYKLPVQSDEDETVSIDGDDLTKSGPEGAD